MPVFAAGEGGYAKRIMTNDLSLLLARVALGASVASHGAQKGLGWFSGAGPEKSASFFEGLGFRPGHLFRNAAVASEIGGSLLTVLGLGGPIGPLTLLSTMIVAGRGAHANNGFFAQQGGFELTSAYGTAALGLAASGPGRYSLDTALGWDERLEKPWVLALGIAGALVGAYAILGQRSPSPPPSNANGKPQAAEPAPAHT
ncbi:MAG: DoxX family protein [Candidatus Velthaea sp.]|jgi:putative oxidoreductase